MDKNRIVIQKMDGGGKVVRDYLNKNEAKVAYYAICDEKGYDYGVPIYKNHTQIGLETGGIGHDYRIVLYI